MDLAMQVLYLQQQVDNLSSRIMNMASRGTTVEDDNSKGIQQAKIRGQHGEEIPKVQRWEQFGLTSRPPAGSDALILSINGTRDSAQMVAVSSPDSRLTDGAEGSTTLYDAAGNKVYLDNGGNIVIEGSGTITIKAADVAIESGTLTHNGVDISETHKHQDVTPGAGLTGVPV